MLKSVSLVASVLLLAAWSGAASAATTFRLSDIAFEDGAKITGEFTANDALTEISAYNVTAEMSRDGQFSSSHFINDDRQDNYAIFYSTYDASDILVPNNTLVFNKDGATLYLGFNKTIDGSKADLLFAFEGQGFSKRSGPSGGSITSISSVTAAVPEPATWAMMLVGFGGIGFAMRRRSGKVRTRIAHAV